MPVPSFLPAVLSAAVVLTPLAAVAAGPPPVNEPLHLSARAFAQEVSLEVRDLPEAESNATLRAAFTKLQQLETTLDGARRSLNTGATEERTVAVEPAVMDLLERTVQFCTWSHGAVGPLGGSLDAHWDGLAGNPSPPPIPAALTDSAACDRIRLDPAAHTVRIAAGSRVSFDAFALGFAVDRTVDALRELGAGNGLVRIGRVQRGFGAGPSPVAGRGWPGVLPTFEGYRQPFDVVRLDERALAVVWRADWPTGRPLFVNQHTGQPPRDVWASAAVTELAIDAQALAVAGLVMGPREGRFRMSALKPEPSVLWLLGGGRGRPLRSDLNWSALHAP